MRYLFFTSGLLAVLFFLLLMAKRDKKYETRFLATIFFLILISSTYIFFFYTSHDFYYIPFFSELNYAIPLLYGTLLWFYTRSIVSRKFRMKPIDYLHFVPFIVFYIFLIYPILSENKYNYYNDEFGFPLIKLLITPIYLFAVLYLLRVYQGRLLDHYSDTARKTHAWLSWITVGAIGFWVIACIGYFTSLTGEDENGFINEYYILSFLAIYLFVLGFIAFSRTEIFKFNKSEIETVADEIEEVYPIECPSKEDEERFSALLQFMKIKKPYLDNQLTLSKLSGLTSIPNYKLSNIINQLANQNFHDFINAYRVEELKSKLNNGEHVKLSLLGVALDSGFNSKASFNRIFKNHTKKTPSQYVKEMDKTIKEEPIN